MNRYNWRFHKAVKFPLSFTLIVYLRPIYNTLNCGGYMLIGASIYNTLNYGTLTFIYL